ncbi:MULTISPECIES: nuclear transport factor 2 family protein [unclassified Haladaptatus]|uniref:nuclear transport factor 2 family protein n=1 Tax=unclassified Haladaptatus TaxID=2622732 RepID=UPI0023E76755|nr:MULTISPECIES: nuclear transport factor 2 family protein [unclassified Haladaptatus]
MASSVEEFLEISQLKHEYCYRIDDGDYDEWVSLFTEDGTFGRAGQDPAEGAEGLQYFATEIFDNMYQQTAHLLSNPVIDVDGDEATGQWYLLLQFTDDEGEQQWMQGRYEDEFERVDGEWKLSSVTVVPQASGSL